MDLIPNCLNFVIYESVAHSINSMVSLSNVNVAQSLQSSHYSIFVVQSIRAFRSKHLVGDFFARLVSLASRNVVRVAVTEKIHANNKIHVLAGAPNLDASKLNGLPERLRGTNQQRTGVFDGVQSTWRSRIML